MTRERRSGARAEGYDVPELKTVDGIPTTPKGHTAWFTDSETVEACKRTPTVWCANPANGVGLSCAHVWFDV